MIQVFCFPNPSFPQVGSWKADFMHLQGFTHTIYLQETHLQETHLQGTPLRRACFAVVDYSIAEFFRLAARDLLRGVPIFIFYFL